MAARREFKRVAEKVMRVYERSERRYSPCGALLCALQNPVTVRHPI